MTSMWGERIERVIVAHSRGGAWASTFVSQWTEKTGLGRSLGLVGWPPMAPRRGQGSSV